MSWLPPNARILEYKIIERLGSGGFANTYLATDVNLNRKVAIKEFFPHRLCDRGEEFNVVPKPGSEDAFNRLLGNFIAEAQILAKFDVPNIVKVTRYFEGLGTAYIIMDYVEGRRLDDIIADNQVVSDLTTRRWLEGLLKGLGAIHEADIIHGDIKPSNIIITGNGDPVLIDFGASVAFQTMSDTMEAFDQLYLTRRYAAPEAFTDPPTIDHRFDLFALAAVFFEVITLEKFQGDDAPDRASTEILAYGRHHDAKLLKSIERSLRAKPDERFDTAEDWLDQLTLSGLQKFSRGIGKRKYSLAATVIFLAAIGWAANYAVTNQIDGRNYTYKLFTDKSEVERLLTEGTSYAARVEDAHQSLLSYANEYKSHVGRLADENLITARNNKTTLLNSLDRLNPPMEELTQLAREFRALRDKHYFDGYGSTKEKTDRVFKSVDPIVFALNQNLLAAIVENGVMTRARREDVSVDTPDLARLITGIQNADDKVSIDRIIAHAGPKIDAFLTQQRAKNTRRKLEDLRANVRADISALNQRYGKRRNGGELATLLGQVDAAATERQLTTLQIRASAIARRIEKTTAVALKKQKQLRLDSEIRSGVQKIEAAMVTIDSGSFRMGGENQGYARPVHPVTVKGFRLGVNEVTVAQWNLCVKDDKCAAKPAVKGPNVPVTGVSWDETQAYINWLNSRSRRYRFRLPSEAEWEYVVKKYGYKLKELKPKIENVSVDNHNAKGVNSIVGNALEWLDDCWHGGYFGAPTDGSSWNRGLYCSQRVVRGSNWNGKYDFDQNQITYFRPVGLKKTERLDTLGFRLAGTPK